MSIAKVDVDLRNRPQTFGLWVRTRKWIIEKLGYTLEKVNVRETQHGYHVWFHIAESVDDQTLAVLQFLLGDDQKRCKFNFLRWEAGAFDNFNALFSKKLKKYGMNPPC